MFLNGKFHRTNPVGKPRTRWEDVVRGDTLQILEIRGLKRRAEDREEGRRLLSEDRVQKRLGAIHGMELKLLVCNFLG
jgi:hypothetical protein